jgi:hypothetical protein
LTIKKSTQGDALIGMFRSEDGGCPGIPVDPEVLKQKETFKMEYVEIEFASKDGKMPRFLS